MVGFSNINSLLDKDDEQKRGTDTLAQPSPVREGDPEAQEQQQTQIAATSTAPTLGKSKTGADKGQAALPSTAAAQAIIAKGQSSYVDKIGEGIGSKIKEAGTALEAEATKYKADIGAKTSSAIDKSALSKAYQTGEGLQDIGRTLGTEDLTLQQFKPDVKLPQQDLEALRTRAGQELLLERSARKQTPQYTTGMSALDVAISRRTPSDFSGVIEQAADVQRREGVLTGEAEAAEQQAQSAFDTRKQNIRDYLSQLASGTREAGVAGFDTAKAAAADAKESQITSTRANVLSQAPSTLDNAITQGLAKQEDYGYIREYYKAHVDAIKQATQEKLNNLDAEQFYTTNLDNLTADDFVSQEEATRFNRIQELLGSSERIIPGELKPQSKFDAAAYNAATQAILAEGLSDIEAYSNARAVRTGDPAVADADKVMTDISAKYNIDPQLIEKAVVDATKVEFPTGETYTDQDLGVLDRHEEGVDKLPMPLPNSIESDKYQYVKRTLDSILESEVVGTDNFNAKIRASSTQYYYYKKLSDAYESGNQASVDAAYQEIYNRFGITPYQEQQEIPVLGGEMQAPDKTAIDEAFGITPPSLGGELQVTSKKTLDELFGIG